MNWKVFHLVFLVFLITVRIAAASENLSLSDALRMAKKNHISVLVANERVAQALAVIAQNGSGLWPQVSGSVSQTRQTRDLRSSGVNLGGDPLVGPFNAFDARVRLTQTIFDASVIKRLETAKNNYQMSVSEQRKAEQDAMALVATLFVEAKRAQAQAKLSKEFLARDQQKLRISLEQLRQGIGSDLEVNQSKANYYQSLSLWRQQKMDAFERRLDLLAALGIPFDEDVVIVDEPVRQIHADRDMTELLAHHPDVQVLQNELKSAKSKREIEAANYWPKISVLGDYGESGVEPNDSNETYTLGVQATVAFWEGGLRKARIQEADSQIREAKNQLTDTQRHTEAKIKIANETIEQAKDFLRQKQAELRVARTNLAIAKRAQSLGSQSEIQVHEALAQLALNQNQKEEAGATYVMAKINLAHAVGKMEALIDDQEGDSGEE